MKLHSYPARPADYWTALSPTRTQCGLCPRHCQPRNGQMGYCGVRGTVEGALHTFNYGLALAATEEVIETEAVNHYSPGARILSMGNVGCMMSCTFCQNWETSQIKHLQAKQIRQYTPQQIVDICLANQIGVLSWTYNDPVVWQEFVVATSRLAQQNGITTLYKSAFYIEAAPVDELIDCIDIFSLSLKSLSEDYYRKVTKARLQPVLARIQQVARSGRHLELSYLVIPGLNDTDEDMRRAIAWVLENVGAQVPFHFVAFHPAYKYTSVTRTPLDTLLRARDMALSMGVQTVFLGNTHQSGLNDSDCRGCGAMQVRRYGLHAEPMNLTADGHCTQCGLASGIQHPLRVLAEKPQPGSAGDLRQQMEMRWSSEVQSVHIMLTEGQPQPEILRLRPLGPHAATERRLQTGLDRFVVSRQSLDDQGIVVSWDSDNQYQFFPILDRAHYPVAPVADATPIVLTE